MDETEIQDFQAAATTLQEHAATAGAHLADVRRLARAPLAGAGVEEVRTHLRDARAELEAAVALLDRSPMVEVGFAMAGQRSARESLRIGLEVVARYERDLAQGELVVAQLARGAPGAIGQA